MALLLAVEDVPAGLKPLTRLGGYPIVPRGIVWPRCVSCGRWLAFVGQLRVPQLLGREAPEGLVHLFQCLSCEPTRAGATVALNVSPHPSQLMLAPGGDAKLWSPRQLAVHLQPLKLGETSAPEQLSLYRGHLDQAAGAIVGQSGRWPIGFGQPRDPQCSCISPMPMRFLAQIEENGMTGLGFGQRATVFVFFCEQCRRAEAVRQPYAGAVPGR